MTDTVQVTDFEMYAGDTKQIQVDVVDLDDVAVDLIDATIVWEMASSKWKRQTSPTVYIRKTTNSGDGITLSMTQGRFFIDLDSIDTDGLSGNFYHEAQITTSGGVVGTALVGVITIKKNLIPPA